MATNFFDRRRDRLCRARANNSLPVPLAPFDQHRALALGNLGQQLKNLPHRRAAPNDVREGILLLQFAVQRLDQPQVPEAFHPADNPAPIILQRCRGDADGNFLAARINDIDHLVDHRTVRGERLLQRAGVLADARPEHVTAAAAHRLAALDPGDLLGGAVKERHAPLGIHREYAVWNVVQQVVQHRSKLKPEAALMPAPTANCHGCCKLPHRASLSVALCLSNQRVCSHFAGGTRLAPWQSNDRPRAIRI